MGLSCSCDLDYDADDRWFEPGRRRVPPKGETCCECDAPLPTDETCQTIIESDVYDPGVDRPPYPDDVLDVEPECAVLARHWDQRYRAMEKAQEDFDDEFGWDGDREQFVKTTLHYRCERCEGLATALDGSKEEGGLDFCMILPGELIQAHGDYIEMSGGAERIWKRDRAGVLHPRPLTRWDRLNRAVRYRWSRVRSFIWYGGWKTWLRFTVKPSITRRSVDQIMRSLGYHKDYDFATRRMRWKYGFGSTGMIWVRRQMQAQGLEAHWPGKRQVWRFPAATRTPPIAAGDQSPTGAGAGAPSASNASQQT